MRSCPIDRPLYIAIAFALGYLTCVVLDVAKRQRPKSIVRFFVPPSDGTPIPLPEGLHFDVVTIGFQEYIRIVGNNHAMAVLEAGWKRSVDPYKEMNQIAREVGRAG